MTALVRPPCTTYVTDGLCVFSYFSVPHSIIRYQRVKCSSTIPRAHTSYCACTANIYSAVTGGRHRKRAAAETAAVT